MMNNMSIIDLDGQIIRVTDLQAAITQATMFAAFTEAPEPDTEFSNKRRLYWSDMVNKLNTLRVSIANSLHEEAMDLCEEVDDIKRKKGTEESIGAMLIRAYDKERAAADLALDNEEPSRSILYHSAMHIAKQAKCLENALATAKLLASFTKYYEYKEEAEQMIKQLQTQIPNF